MDLWYHGQMIKATHFEFDDASLSLSDAGRLSFCSKRFYLVFVRFFASCLHLFPRSRQESPSGFIFFLWFLLVFFFGSAFAVLFAMLCAPSTVVPGDRHFIGFPLLLISN